MLSENMTSSTSDFIQKFNIGQFCIFYLRIFAHWLNARVGIHELPAGCRAIPAGHMNFDPALAKAFGGRDGVNRAIIFQFIANWVIYNTERGKNYVDGRFWSYNSARAWAKMIELWDMKTVERHLGFLRDANMLDAQAIKAHRGDQTLWYTLPAKDSNGGDQMPLWLESNAGMTPAKAPHDSSISQAAHSKPTIRNRKQQQQPRASAHLDTGGVAKFPKRDLDPKEFADPKPEVRAAEPSEDGDDERSTPPPVAPAPSPAAVPTWMSEFFDGCAEAELAQLVQQYGEKLLEDSKRYALNPLRKIQNPPGYVRSQLAKGWRPPKGQGRIEGVRYDNTDGRAYVTGEFAAFVQH